MKLYYCLVRMSALRILSISDKDHLMTEIRYEIIPYLFKSEGLLNGLLIELNRVVTIDDVYAHAEERSS